MDYCSSCRRYVNGALMCPGCGVYAADIAPAVAPHGMAATSTVPALTALASDAPAARPPGAWDSWHDTAGPDGPESGPDARDAAPLAEDVESPALTGEGRAARRRQRARWKKNQRRALVATAVALIGGGLTVTSLDRHSAARPQAAAAPDNHGMGLADELPEQPLPATPNADRASTTPPRSQTPGTDSAPRQRTVAAAQRTASSATHPDATHPNAVHPDAVGPPRPAVTSVPVQPSAAPSVGTPSVGALPAAAPSTAASDPTRTSTAAQQPSAPETAASAPTRGTAPSAPATQPAWMCAMGRCVG
ncbi:SCO2400 family protein [Streptomyces sp. NPDC004752]